MSKPRIYTIGHSTHAIDYFVNILKQYEVNCLVDVRTLAASRFNPQYNKNRLSASLRDENIYYLHMPEEFGARHIDSALLTNGQVDFNKVRQSETFKHGIEKLRHETNKGQTLALMCAEADPLDCHRFSMISFALKDDFEIMHILKDGFAISNEGIEQQLIDRYKKKLPSDLFATDFEDRLQQAYRLKNLEIGYKPDQHK